MALSQRPIQRKRIHKLSTAAAWRANARWLLAALFAAAGCAGSGAASPSLGMLALTPDPAGGVPLSPGMSKPVGFILTSDGVPVAGKTVSFSITDPAAAKGATLAASSAVTDVRGAAAVTLVAGPEASFTVQGSYGGQENVIAVVVTAGRLGKLEASPYWADSDPPADATGIEVTLWIESGCADVDASKPVPRNGPPPLEGSPQGSTVAFTLVPASKPIALVGRAHNASNTTLATVCVDVPAGSLVPDGVVVVPLPLAPLRPDPVGTFAVTSQVTFSPPLAAAAALAAPWQDLADCPLDPAQLWLDCTTDALSGSSADDPLDCVPATTPGGEGPLGDALADGRGLFILDPAGVASACRGGRDGFLRISLDAVALGLFGSPLPAQVAALPAIANDAAHLLDGMTLQSNLVVAPGGAPSTYVVTHTLGSVQLGTSLVDLALAPLGLPVLTAFTTARADDGLFTIGRHGFTLRLGAIARRAFAEGLVARGFAGKAVDVVTTAEFVTDLYDLADSAASPDGCATLDRAICPRVGYAVGCLADACARGLAALAARLDQAFDPANGSGLDFTLSGSAPLLFDPLGAGFANKVHLGLTTSDRKRLGVWSSVELLTAAGRSTFAGTFTGVRQN